MAVLSGPAVLLLVTLFVSSAQDKATVDVRYMSQSITSPKGSSIKLTCNAFYDLELCGLVHVAWYHMTKQGAELTDPSRYLTTVNETAISDDNTKHRQVVTEILNLTAGDAGQFQCVAVCEKDTVAGHYIWITVIGPVCQIQGDLVASSSEDCRLQPAETSPG